MYQKVKPRRQPYCFSKWARVRATDPEILCLWACFWSELYFGGKNRWGSRIEDHVPGRWSAIGLLLAQMDQIYRCLSWNRNSPAFFLSVALLTGFFVIFDHFSAPSHYFPTPHWPSSFKFSSGTADPHTLESSSRCARSTLSAGLRGILLGPPNIFFQLKFAVFLFQWARIGCLREIEAASWWQELPVVRCSCIYNY